MVPFGGWEMPLSYAAGTIDEHLACRRGGGRVRRVATSARCASTAPMPLERLQWALTNDLTKIAPGRAQYTHLLDEDDGSVLDDIIVWWIDDEVFDVMPNASNTDRVRRRDRRRRTPRRAGPCSPCRVRRRERASAELSPEAAAVGRFRVAARRDRRRASCVVAGTGYTGEDGVEIAVPADARRRRCGRPLLGAGVVPAGLGARDTLRLEAALPLHGHELGPGITPLQAGLGWVVAWGKDDVPRPRGARGRAGQRGVGAPAARHRHRGPAAAAGRQRGARRRPAGRRGHQRQLLAGARPRHRPRVPAARRRRRRTTVAIDVRGSAAARHGRADPVRRRATSRQRRLTWQRFLASAPSSPAGLARPADFFAGRTSSRACRLAWTGGRA